MRGGSRAGREQTADTAGGQDEGYNIPYIIRSSTEYIRVTAIEVNHVQQVLCTYYLCSTYIGLQQGCRHTSESEGAKECSSHVQCAKFFCDHAHIGDKGLWMINYFFSVLHQK